MALEPGRNLGPYRIVSPLGAGGMGEVYRATDTRLGRDVALKVLPESVAGSPELRARFEREARAVASLSHPGILSIHDFGTEGGQTFAAMELLEGETLRSRLATGPLAPRRATEYALQLAQALAAAHDKGVVHRDVKPDNVFVTREGRVKVLDFGLARQGSSLLTSSGDDSVSPTLAPGTEPGTVLGTVGYMSPEQVKGQEADARSDIFSFGAVLYEMLTGKRAFRGETAAETMTAILRADPPEPASVHEGIPLALERIVDHCLEKSPDRRFRTAHDLAFALETASGASSRSAAAVAVAAADERPRWRWLAWGAAGLLALAVAVQAGRLLERRAPAAVGASVAPGAVLRLTNRPGPERWPQISPDGKTLAFVAGAATAPDEGDVFIQRVGGGNAINLTPDSPGDDTHPAFSPDGSRIAFRSEREGGGLFVMGSTGESVKRLADFGYNPSWSPDAREIVVSTVSWGEVFEPLGNGRAVGDRRVLRGPAPDRDPRRRRPASLVAPRPPHRVLERLQRGPEGRLHRGGGRRGRGRGDDRRRDRLGPGVVARRAAPRLLERPRGDDEPLAGRDRRGEREGARATGAAHRPLRLGRPRQPLGRRSDARLCRPRGADDADAPGPRSGSGRASGPAAVVLGGSLVVREQAISPDGEWVAFTTTGREDVFVVRADGTGFRQLTDDAFRDRGPGWSPDGRRLSFYSNREGDYQAFTVRPDGSELKRVSAVPGGLWYPAWSPDGSELAVCTQEGAWRIDLRQPVGEAAARRLPPIDETHLFCARSWSPDGTALAGVADRPRSRVARDSRPLAGLRRLPAARRPERRRKFSGSTRGASWSGRPGARSRSWTRGRARPGSSRGGRAHPCRRTVAGSPTWSSPRRPTCGWRRCHEPRGRPPPRPVRDRLSPRRRRDGGGLPRPRPPPRARRGDQGPARALRR